MLPRRPLPINLKVRDLNHAERLCLLCPVCGKEIGEECYSVTLKLPPEYLVARYVARHYCRRCSRKGKMVRPDGWIQGYPRSGAEGYNQRPTAPSGTP